MNTTPAPSYKKKEQECPYAPEKNKVSIDAVNITPFKLEEMFDSVAEDNSSSSNKLVFHSRFNKYITVNEATERIRYLQSIEVPDMLDQPTKLELLQYQDVYNEMTSLQKEIDILQMEEIEQELEAENNHLIHIDGRYVKIIENENKILREELENLKLKLNYCEDN